MAGQMLFPYLANLIPFAGLRLVIDDECKGGHWCRMF